ncbi:MAG: hypothetical protein K1X71_06945 [Pirellulales bacterium]|nr:hypothetical protein [Pirellulales bacterium]
MNQHGTTHDGEHGVLVVRAHQMRRGHRSGAGSPRVQWRWPHLKRDFQALVDSGDH